MTYSGVCFDYAGATADKHKGTVFTEARVELTMSLKGPPVEQSARRILDAQTLPGRAFPSWPGKTVPGLAEPLHRLINVVGQKANREKAIATCNDA